ncbi:hypothetical protein NPIL_417521, partial [Nephila pilipes]
LRVLVIDPGNIVVNGNGRRDIPVFKDTVRIKCLKRTFSKGSIPPRNRIAPHRPPPRRLRVPTSSLRTPAQSKRFPEAIGQRKANQGTTTTDILSTKARNYEQFRDILTRCYQLQAR